MALDLHREKTLLHHRGVLRNFGRIEGLVHSAVLRYDVLSLQGKYYLDALTARNVLPLRAA